jgi:hypothetical protein
MVMKGDYVQRVNRFYTSFFVLTNEKIKSGVHGYDICCSICGFLCSLYFVDRCLSFCPFPFGHYIVCSSIYDF